MRMTYLGLVMAIGLLALPLSGQSPPPPKAGAQAEEFLPADKALRLDNLALREENLLLQIQLVRQESVAIARELAKPGKRIVREQGRWKYVAEEQTARIQK